MARELHVGNASITFEESPAEDPEGPFRSTPSLKFFLSLIFDTQGADSRPVGGAFLFAWSARMIFLGKVMRTIDKIWAPEIGEPIPPSPTPLDLQFRLVLYPHVADVLRRRHPDQRIGRLEVRATVLQVDPVRPMEYEGNFTFYTKRVDRSNVEFKIGPSTSSLQIPEKQTRQVR